MLLVILVLSGVAILATRRLSDRPGGLQNFIELLVQGLADFVESIGGPTALKYLPLFGTLLLFLVVSNWLSVVPFVGQVRWLHSPTADYHINAGLALLAFGLYQAEGLRENGPGYLKRWVNLSGFMEKGGLKLMLGPIFLLVGLIEFASELFRILTLTLRLWRARARHRYRHPCGEVIRGDGPQPRRRAHDPNEHDHRRRARGVTRDPLVRARDPSLRQDLVDAFLARIRGGRRGCAHGAPLLGAGLHRPVPAPVLFAAALSLGAGPAHAARSRSADSRRARARRGCQSRPRAPQGRS